MRVLGLTGSMGMGKSTTAKLFAEAGVPVYDADATVHKVYEGEAAPAIEAAFPGTTVGGKVDRSKLSAKVVGDPEAIRRLEAIVHPMLRSYHQDFLDKAAQSGVPVAVVDVPLLFETGGDKRVEALRIADIYRAKVVDSTLESFVFEITGAPEKLDAFADMMRPLGLCDLARTGVAALVRGN